MTVACSCRSGCARLDTGPSLGLSLSASPPRGQLWLAREAELMSSLFEHEVFPPPLSPQPASIVGPVWTDARTLARIIVERPMRLSASAEEQAIHGLTLLAIRQSEAIQALGEAGLSDQAPGLCRSLFETLVNLNFVAGVGSNSDLADRALFSEKFLDFFVVINQKYLNKARDLKNSPYADLAKFCHDFELQYGSKFDSASAAYLSKHGSLPQYWNGMGPSRAASQKALSLEHFYAWCCNYSHSNVYACRTLFQQSGQDEPQFKPWPFTQIILYSSTFLLLNVLGIFFESFEGYDEQLNRVKTLAARLTASPTAI